MQEFFQEYNSKVPEKQRDEHSSYAYDAVWAMALALNRTLTKRPGMRLDLLDYGQNETINLLIDELDNSSFTGITVSFFEIACELFLFVIWFVS